MKFLATNVKAEKIDSFIFQIFEMIWINFQIENRFEKAHFFETTFLVTDTNIEVVFEMFLFFFNNVNIKFVGKKLLLMT